MLVFFFNLKGLFFVFGKDHDFIGELGGGFDFFGQVDFALAEL